MKRTYIAAILIAVTASSASAQQTTFVPYQAGQSWSAPGYQAYQQPVQYQSFPVQQTFQSSSFPVQPAPVKIQGQYYTVPQAVPTVPTTASVTSTAPAPAPSIPPQPGDLIFPAPASAVAVSPVQQVEASVFKTQEPKDLVVSDQVVVSSTVPAPAPSIPAQPEDFMVPAATPTLVAQPEQVKPFEQSVLDSPEAKDLAVSEAGESMVEPVQEVLAGAETTNLGNQFELAQGSEEQGSEERALAGQTLEAPALETAPSLEGTANDLSRMLVADPEVGVEASRESNEVERAIESLAGAEVAAADSVEGPLAETTDSIEIAESGVADSIAIAEPEVDEEFEIEVAESSTFNAVQEVAPADAIVSAPVETVVETVREPLRKIASSSIGKKSKSTFASAAPANFRRTSNYSGWLLAIIPMLAIPFIGWLALRKRRQDAEVNSFAHEALSRVNSNPTVTKREAGANGSTASKNSGQTRLEAMVKGVNPHTGVEANLAATSESNSKEVSPQLDSSVVHDQFCCIRGIDAATQKALHGAGYVRFSDLENATESEIEIALSNTDHQFSSNDFSRWSTLSALASQGDWAVFESLQASFAKQESTAARSEKTVTAPVAAPAPVTTPVAAGDDLTKIRGIGPATAELLREAGVSTFQSLSKSGTVRLQEILTAGGSKFDAIDPSMWCRQAQYLISGTWAPPREESVVGESESSAVESKSSSVATGLDVTITTPGYRTAEPTMAFSVASDQAPAETTVGAGVLSKEEVDRLEQLAITPSKLSEESALLDQINSIREIATSAAESKVSGLTEGFSAADMKKASAE